MSEADSISSNYARDMVSDTSAERQCEPELGSDVAKIIQDEGRTLRKSCDRCHQQKLRCIGGRTPLSRCTRCQRAGAECVYSARCNKQSHRNKNRHGGSSPNNSPVPRPPSAKSFTPQLSDIDTGLDPYLMDCDDLFARLPSWDDAALSSFTMPMAPSSDVLDMPTSAGSFSFSSCSTTPELDSVSSDSPCGRLSCVCQALEATYTKVLGEQTGHPTHEFPSDEVYAIFERFLGILVQNEMAPITASRKPLTTSDECMRIKLGATAVHGYVLCMKLMMSLSEQMLRNLLATPHSTSLGSPTSFDATRLGSDAGQRSNTFNAEDAFASAKDPFQHVLNSKLTTLETGIKLLGRMEQLLGIPPDLGVGVASAGRSLDPAALDSASPNLPTRLTLPARLVASIWEDEVSMNNRSVVTYFRRCRAAIVGLVNAENPAHQHLRC